jgi:predicted PurR-regulated permease PerM
MERTVKMALALLIIIILTAVIVYATLPFLNYFFGSFILYVIFRPLYRFFVRKARIRKQFASVLVIIISIFVVLIPLYFLLNVIIGEIQQLLLEQATIVAYIQSNAQFLTHYLSMLDLPTDAFQTKIQEKIMDIGSGAFNYTSTFILGSIQNLSQQSIGLFIMYFLLYYLLTEEESDFIHKTYAAIPFNAENTTTLVDEFGKIVRTTLISTGALALFQGAILTITFLIFSIRGAFLWGALAAVFSFLPVLGAPLIWVPAAIVQLLLNNYIAGIAILAVGISISVIENFLRPIIQQRVGEIHPFLSLVGIVIGVSLFGLIGIVIGPLLLSYFLLTVEMFSREYLSQKE